MPRTLKDINIEVGARIKEKRLAQKLTREDLARLSGYTANFIQEVERGRSGLSSESIRALSMALCGHAIVRRSAGRICPHRTAVEVCSTPKTETYSPNYRGSYCLFTMTKSPALYKSVGG